MCTKSCLFSARSNIVSQRLASNFLFFEFVYDFLLDPEPEPKCITVQVPLWQEVAVPAVPVPASVPLLRSM